MSKDYHLARPEKGENLLKAINDYTVLDLETTGLDPDFDSIIEIGAQTVSRACTSCLVRSGRLSRDHGRSNAPRGE